MDISDHDPNELGPFGICFRCYAPRSDERSYCTRCGHLYGFMVADKILARRRCKLHPESLATNFCSGCAEPMCDTCLNTEHRGVSMASGQSTQFCPDCLRNMADLDKQFREALKISGSCAKHATHPATFTCDGCSLPHCDACGYFTVKEHLFRRSLGVGPLCLPCFRMATTGDDRRRWASLMDKGRINRLKSRTEKVGRLTLLTWSKIIAIAFLIAAIFTNRIASYGWLIVGILVFLTAGAIKKDRDT